MAVVGATLAEVFVKRIAKSPDAPALRVKEGDEWRKITFREYDIQAREAGNGLIALGIQNGDHVAMLSRNRPEWHIGDAGAILAGAITVPIYVTNSAPQVSYVLGHGECRVVIVENQEQLDKVLKFRDELPELSKVVVMTGDGAGSDELVMSFEELRKMGADHASSHPGDLDERIKAIKPEDVATIVYTAGTTGNPKGVILTHRNFTWTLETLGKVLPVGDCEDRILCYLPLSHIFERLASLWGGVFYGFDVWFCDSTDKILEYLKQCEPTFFIGVPRIYEKFYSGVSARYATHEKKDVIAKALQASLAKVDIMQAGDSLPLSLKVKNALFDKLVFSKTREELGMGNVRFAITAAAPITSEVMRFVHALGIDLVEAYGQTEVNGPTAVTTPGKARFGTVGPVLPGMEIKFASDGEILVRGPNVFAGYFKEPDLTASVMDPEGFLITGDVGELDEKGYLKITDRKKDIIITAGGKNVAPQEIEGRLKVHTLISQAVVIGDKRPFISALLTLDADAAPKWAQEHGIDATDHVELTDNPKVLEEIGAAVAKVNEELSQVEKIKKWKLLPRDLSQDEGELTPKLSVRRKVVLERYTGYVEEMYSK